MATAAWICRVEKKELNCHATFSPDRKYRYRLSRTWNEGVAPLVWIMLNPSTADESRDDPTIRRCMAFSINFGFGGCVIHNLFAWRSTDPAKLAEVDDPVGPFNDDGIIQDAMSHKVVCAWGNVDKRLKWREENVLAFLEGLDLNCLKLNGTRAPAHPLYLHSGLCLKTFPSGAIA